jgi:hypothetical protein
MSRSRIIVPGLALALALGVAGCGSSPKTQFFTLMAEPPPSGAMPGGAMPGGAMAGGAMAGGAVTGRTKAGHGGRPLQVGDVALPGTLDRAALVIQGPGPQINVSDRDRWAAPLDELVRRTLTEDLRARLGTGRVIAPGDPAPSGGVRRVVLTVERFSADTAGHVVLSADWTLAVGDPPKAAAIRHVRLEENAGSTSGAAVASAMSRALGRLADQIAATA